MTTAPVPVSRFTPAMSLTTTQFGTLAEIAPALEGIANLSRTSTRRAFRQDIADVRAFEGLGQPEAFRDIPRTHVVAWREDLARRALAYDTLQYKRAARSSLDAYLYEKPTEWHHPGLGLKRCGSMDREGGTPVLGDHQARTLLEARPEDHLNGQRDRTIPAALRSHAVRGDLL